MMSRPCRMDHASMPEPDPRTKSLSAISRLEEFASPTILLDNGAYAAADSHSKSDSPPSPKDEFAEPPVRRGCSGTVVIFCETRPRFGDPVKMESFRRFLDADGIEVVFIDPVFLCLPCDLSPAKLFDIARGV